MPRKNNLVGQRFGKLIVLVEDGRDAWGAVMWKCQCDCGECHRARGSQMKSGATASCGCGVSEAAVKNNRTHGGTGSPLYVRWHSMLQRCFNPSGSEYHNYGGRGISVCESWRRSFEAFASDMGDGFSERLQLDRINVDGNYEPSNCRWATRLEQQRNKRNNNRVEWRGENLTITEWAERLGIKPNTLIYRLRRGWPIDRAMTIGIQCMVTRDHALGRFLSVANK